MVSVLIMIVLDMERKGADTKKQISAHVGVLAPDLLIGSPER